MELGDIKARANAWRHIKGYMNRPLVEEALEGYRADLDRAIAIAELSDAALDGFAIQVERLTKERDEARLLAEEKQIAFNMMMDERVEVSTGELQQARADVLKLRDDYRHQLKNDWQYGDTDIAEALADTEHYEKYR